MRSYSSAKVELQENFETTCLDQSIWSIQTTIHWPMSTEVYSVLFKFGGYSELVFFNFAIKYRMGKSERATGTLNHHSLNPDSPLESVTDRDKVDVISYPLVCDDTNEDNVETTSYSSVCEIVIWHLGTTRILNDLEMEAQAISCTAEPLVKEEEHLETMAQSNSIKVFGQATPAIMAKEQHKDPILGLVYQYVLAGNELRPADS